jgi:hypothetical protein
MLLTGTLSRSGPGSGGGTWALARLKEATLANETVWLESVVLANDGQHRPVLASQQVGVVIDVEGSGSGAVWPCDVGVAVFVRLESKKTGDGEGGRPDEGGESYIVLDPQQGSDPPQMCPRSTVVSSRRRGG